MKICDFMETRRSTLAPKLFLQNRDSNLYLLLIISILFLGASVAAYCSKHLHKDIFDSEDYRKFSILFLFLCECIV